ncbi:hypothetical protein ACFL5D_00380 [Candidatus Neomarinimicrobiota bacterium]
MNKSIIRIIVAVFVVLIFMPNSMIAQNKDNAIHYEIVQYHVDRAKIDSLKVLENQYYTKIISEAKRSGLIIDSVLLIMKVGDNEYNVVEVTKYPSWSAIDGFSWDDAFKSVEPDKKKRDAVDEAYEWFFEGKDRISAIYYEAADYK